MAKAKTGAQPKKSRTVDLRGFKRREIRLIAYGSWDVKLPPVAMAAITRLLRASHGREPKTIANIDRESLEALARGMRRHVARFADAQPELAAAVAKLDARLKAPRGPRVNSTLWMKRAEDVRRVTRDIERESGHATDSEIESRLGLTPLTLGRWRFRKPELFGPPRPRR
ncbi:MAG: hypothetical protein ACTHJG_00110 [Rhodanobacteraceae bacterium]